MYATAQTVSADEDIDAGIVLRILIVGHNGVQHQNTNLVILQLFGYVGINLFKGKNIGLGFFQRFICLFKSFPCFRFAVGMRNLIQIAADLICKAGVLTGFYAGVDQEIANSSAVQHDMTGGNQMQDQCRFQTILRELVIIQKFLCFVIVCENNMLRRLRREEEITAHVALAGSEIIDEIRFPSTFCGLQENGLGRTGNFHVDAAGSGLFDCFQILVNGTLLILIDLRIQTGSVGLVINDEQRIAGAEVGRRKVVLPLFQHGCVFLQNDHSGSA